MSDITSRPFKPSPDKCCERCVFGRGEHADWCKRSHDVEALMDTPLKSCIETNTSAISRAREAMAADCPNDPGIAMLWGGPLRGRNNR